VPHISEHKLVKPMWSWQVWQLWSAWRSHQHIMVQRCTQGSRIS